MSAVITHRVGRVSVRSVQGGESCGGRRKTALFLVGAGACAGLLSFAFILIGRGSGSAAQAAPVERKVSGMFLFGGKKELGECEELGRSLTFWAVTDEEPPPALPPVPPPSAMPTTPPTVSSPTVSSPSPPAPVAPPPPLRPPKAPRQKIVEDVLLFGTEAPGAWHHVPLEDAWQGEPTARDFGRWDMTEWNEDRWYIIEQQVTKEEPAESLFCATLSFDYKSEKPSRNEVLKMFSYRNERSVNGEVASTLQCARVPEFPKEKDEAYAPWRLSTSACWMPGPIASAFSHDYWVSDVGYATDEGLEYEWAIIVAGQPRDAVYHDEERANMDGCTAEDGIWLLARTPKVSEVTMSAMYLALTQKGIATSLLAPVVHAGCEYKGAPN